MKLFLGTCFLNCYHSTEVRHTGFSPQGHNRSTRGVAQVWAWCVIPRYRRTSVEMRSKEFDQGDLRQRELCTDTKEWLGEGLCRLSFLLLLKADTSGHSEGGAALCTGLLEDHRWQIPVVSSRWTLPAQFSPVSSCEIRGPFSKPKYSMLLMKQCSVCLHCHSLFAPLLKCSRFRGGWRHAGGNIPCRSEETQAFFGFGSEKNSRGKPDLAGKLRQS